MSTDIRVDSKLPRHRKYKKLKRLLGGQSPMETLVVFWGTVAEQEPSGMLDGWECSDIEDAAGWDGEPGALFAALLESGFLDQIENGYYPHDWVVHQPWVTRSEGRSDGARFSRLKQVAPEAHAALKDKGVTAISKADYEKLVAHNKSVYGDSPADSQPIAGGPLAPAPAPAPAPNARKSMSASKESSGSTTSDPLPAEPSGQTTTPKTMTATEKQLRTAVADQQEFLRKKFPSLDFELETEELVAKFRDKPIGCDASLLVLRWFRKAKPPGNVTPGTGESGSSGSKADKVRLRNKEAVRKFCGEEVVS